MKLTLSSLIAIVVLGFIALYTVAEAIFLQAFPGQRSLYAFTLLVCAAAACIAMASLKLRRGELLGLMIWFGLNGVWTGLVVVQDVTYPRWLIGDLASMILPAFIWLAGTRFPDLFCEKRLILGFCLVLLVGSILSAVIGISPTDRFEAPVTLLFPIAWLGLIRTRSARRLAWAAVLVLLAILAYKSGERTSIILWLLAGIAVFFVYLNGKQLLAAGTISLVLAVGLGTFVFQQAIRDSLAESRFRENIEGRADQSLITRFNEALDVSYHFSRADSVRQMIGHGHGASFWPVHSLTLLNLSDEGYVHHVHIGPAMVLYRYGLIGLALLLGLWWLTVRALFRLRTCRGSPHHDLKVFFTISLALYLVDLMLFNVIPQPGFSYAIAAFVFHISSRSQGLRFVANSASPELSDAPNRPLINH